MWTLKHFLSSECSTCLYFEPVDSSTEMLVLLAVASSSTDFRTEVGTKDVVANGIILVSSRTELC